MSKTTVFGTICEKRQFFTIINIYFPPVKLEVSDKKLVRIRRFLLLNWAEEGKNGECWPQAGEKLNKMLYFASFYRKF